MDVLDKKELRKANGDVFFEAYQLHHQSYIYVNWIGIQSLETMVMGSNHVLSILREKPCKGLLNSNQELIGPWDAAVQYLAYKWAPTASNLGLRWMAHILSPGIYGRKSFDLFKQHLSTSITLKSFEDRTTAEGWLIRHLE
ncbi:hypothetical protein [Sabulibacter ruber]|uniref:hypothetical protein n=1 Tax=Sabulibacter ruber TaxID=2811901 RepID=UPI001A970E2F|nr:hypothetical protein [Sabulibacter ruber]